MGCLYCVHICWWVTWGGGCAVVLPVRLICHRLDPPDSSCATFHPLDGRRRARCQCSATPASSTTCGGPRGLKGTLAAIEITLRALRGGPHLDVTPVSDRPTSVCQSFVVCVMCDVLTFVDRMSFSCILCGNACNSGSRMPRAVVMPVGTPEPMVLLGDSFYSKLAPQAQY